MAGGDQAWAALPDPFAEAWEREAAEGDGPHEHAHAHAHAHAH
jgi:hypothetical protein